MSGFLQTFKIGRFTKLSNQVEAEVRGTSQGSAAVAQVEPDWLELSRHGARFHGGCQVIASGIAPVAAIPTTTATLALFNGEADGGKHYLMEELSLCLGSGTAAAGLAVFVGLTEAKITAPSAAANYDSYSASAGGKSTRAIWGTGVTFAAGVAWRHVGSSMQLAAANVGQGERPYSLRGIIVPPGYALGIGILSGTGTSPLYTVSAQWSELVIDAE